MPSAVARLVEFGQSPWYDNLTRAVATGGLDLLMREHGIRGVTSNPTIFEKAMAVGTDYDGQLRELVGSGKSTEDAYWDDFDSLGLDSIFQHCWPSTVSTPSNL